MCASFGFNALQVLDLSSVQLVYSSSYFKSLSTGGNVSKALVRALTATHKLLNPIFIALIV